MFLNSIFALPALLVVLIVSLLISLIIIFVYKFLTNQKLMKEMKDKLKDYQKQMKENKNDPQKVMALQKEAMSINMKYMSHSMKPTLITFLPIILIFGWMNGHLAYLPIEAGQTFTTGVVFQDGTAGSIELSAPEELTLISNATQEIVNNTALWELKADKNGEYLLEYKYKDKAYTKEILVTSEQAYDSPVRVIKDSDLKNIVINHKPLKTLDIFGFKLGWVWTYILFSIIFSIVLRKMLKVY